MEEQNSANAEESATPTNEPTALSGEADSAESTKSNGRTLKLKASDEQSNPAQSAAVDVSTDSPSTPDSPADEKRASSAEPASEAKSSEPRGNTEEDAQPGRSRCFALARITSGLQSKRRKNGTDVLLGVLC